MLLAESFTPPPGFQPWLMNAAFALWLILLAWKFWDRITGNAQKRDVKMVNEYLTTKDLAPIVKEIARHEGDIQKNAADLKALDTRVFEKGEERKNEILAHVDVKHGALQEQLNEIHGKLGEVSGQLKARHS